MPTRSSRLLALTSPLRHGLVPVRMVMGHVHLKRTETVLANDLVLKLDQPAAGWSLCVWQFVEVEHGEVGLCYIARHTSDHRQPVVAPDAAFIARLFGDPSVRVIVEELLGGPVRVELEDALAAYDLLLEVGHALAAP